jgi:hypothetical protein
VLRVVHGWHATRRPACRSGWYIREDVRGLLLFDTIDNKKGETMIMPIVCRTIRDLIKYDPISLLRISCDDRTYQYILSARNDQDIIDALLAHRDIRGCVWIIQEMRSRQDIDARTHRIIENLSVNLIKLEHNRNVDYVLNIYGYLKPYQRRLHRLSLPWRHTVSIPSNLGDVSTFMVEQQWISSLDLTNDLPSYPRLVAKVCDVLDDIGTCILHHADQVEITRPSLDLQPPQPLRL